MASHHLPSNCCCLQQLHCCCYAKWCNHSANSRFRIRVLSSHGLFSSSKTLLILNLRRRNRRCWRVIANAELRVVADRNSKSSISNAQSPIVPSVEIPVTCYQILGVPEQAEKDEIVKSAMHLRTAQIEEGYTADVVASRQSLLMDVRDKLLFEPEYTGNTKEKIPPKSPLRIPWAWLPGALCLLQEAGEDNIVLDIGQKALQHPDAKLYVHDILLCMALAECEIAKVGFEKNKISQGFEALARAQCLLRSKISLGKMALLSQIEESLEELAPGCTLELLSMPHTPENADRRLGAISALRELLRQGLDVESSRQVKDWPCFLNQALNKLMATEIVELLPWDDLALTRKNKKSLDSQNQRVVIDFNSFYTVLIAHLALGFSCKQLYLINKGKTICECLITSEGIDLKFEEALCLFLLGKGDEATAAEKLRQLELNPDTASRNPVSSKETKDVSNASKLLETWLKDSMLGVFPDTRDCLPSLVNFFAGEKKTSGNRQTKRSPFAMSSMSRRSLVSLASDRRAFNDTLSNRDPLRHLGPAVKQLTPSNSQGSPVEGKVDSGTNVSTPIQLKRNLGSYQNKVWDTWLDLKTFVRKLIYLTLLGCVIYASFRLINSQFWRMGNAYRWRFDKPSWTTDSSVYQNISPLSIKGNRIARNMKKLLGMLVQIRRQPETMNLQKSCLAASLSSSANEMYRLPMPVEEAEALVIKWQEIKAEALGPNHQVHKLFDVLDEAMLDQWQALSDAAETSLCSWRFVLLQLSVVRAEIVMDGSGKEMAEIEAILEEAAELVDESQPKNPNYYSTYKTRYFLKRQHDGSWRFCEADIQAPSE